MKADQFEYRFDGSVDLTVALDLSRAKCVLQVRKWVSIDLPAWMVDLLYREASKIDVSRQSLKKSRTAPHRTRSPFRSKSIEHSHARLFHRCADNWGSEPMQPLQVDDVLNQTR